MFTGKRGKERTTPLHMEAAERLATRLSVPRIRENPAGPPIPAALTPRGRGRDSFRLPRRRAGPPRVRDFKTSGEHRILSVTGKDGKERTTPLHLEAVERLAAWLALPGIGDNPATYLFRPQKSARYQGKDGFRPKPMTTRAVEKLIGRYVTVLGLDPNVTVHSLRVTALTTARKRGSDIIDLQDFAGHADPRTTLTYIRSHDRLSISPAYVLKY